MWYNGTMGKWILEQYGGERWEVEVKTTPKTIMIYPPKEKPRFVYGCLGQYWDKDKPLKVRIPTEEDEDGTGRINGKTFKHHIEKLGEDSYLIYPDRAGIPYALEKIVEK